MAPGMVTSPTTLPHWRLLPPVSLPDVPAHTAVYPRPSRCAPLGRNWRSDATFVDRPPVVLDFADAHLGNPVLDGLRVCEFLPEAKRPTAAQAWIDAWTSRVPNADPASALAVAEPFGHLAYAVRYQEFLDGIEPSERVYHQGDPAASVRAALRSAAHPAASWPARESL